LNLAVARSDPVKPSVSSFFKIMFPLSGSDPKKSITPKAPAMYPDLRAMFETLVPHLAPVKVVATAVVAADNF